MNNDNDDVEVLDSEEEIKETVIDTKEELRDTVSINDNIDVDNNKKDSKMNNKLILQFTIIVIVIASCGGLFVYMNKPVPKPKEETIPNDKKDVKSEYRISGNSLDAFDLYFLQLENEEKNKVYSPLSIKYALEMLSAGADGDTKEQIDSIIGDYQAKKYPNSDHMSFANAMFIRDTYMEQIQDNYKKTLVDKFNAEVITDSFENPNNINRWVSDKTFNLVNDLIDDTSSNDYFLINALAIDMNWNNQIHCFSGSMSRVPCLHDGNYSVNYAHEKIDDSDQAAYSVSDYPYTDDHDFYHFDFNGTKGTKASKILADYNRYDIIKELGEDNIRKTVTEEYQKWLQSEDGLGYAKYDPSVNNVEEAIDKYMDGLKANYGKANNSTDFMLYEDDTVKAFAKDLKEYDGVTLQYVGIMPKEKELINYVDDVKASELNNIIKNLKELKIENFKDGVATIIRGEIPLFKYDYELKLEKDLQKLGIKDVFDSDKADLSKMSKGSYINKAVHKANIEFSNEGIKAAAATGMGGYGSTTGGFEYLFKIPVERIDLNFDKPYMYIIRDKDTGEVWFVGTVYEAIHK